MQQAHIGMAMADFQTVNFEWVCTVVISPALLHSEIKLFDTGSLSAAYDGYTSAVLGAGWGNVMIL